MLYRAIEVIEESFENGAKSLASNTRSQLDRKRSYIADKWYLDEVVVTIKGQQGLS